MKYEELIYNKTKIMFLQFLKNFDIQYILYILYISYFHLFIYIFMFFINEHKIDIDIRRPFAGWRGRIYALHRYYQLHSCRTPTRSYLEPATPVAQRSCHTYLLTMWGSRDSQILRPLVEPQESKYTKYIKYTKYTKYIKYGL